MRKLAKKVLAICLSAVMAGTMLSAVAFATESEATQDDEYGIATLASATVISKDETKTDWSFSGNVYIEKDVTLTLEGTTTISGNVYVFGTLRNNGSLTISGTLHCLHYGGFSASGNYDYGYFLNYGYAKVTTLDVTSKWLDTEIPDTGDDDDDNDGDDGDDEPDTDGGAFSGQHVTVISGDEEKNDWEISGVVYIPKDASLTTTGNVTIDGDVYVVGTLTNEGTLNITGTTYCLNYSGMSAGDYDYGYVYNLGSLSGYAMVVKDSFLSIDFPTSTVHVWGDIEWTLNEDDTSGTATRTCLVCGETETVDVDVTEETVETDDGETKTEEKLEADFGDDEYTLVVDEAEDTTKDDGSTSTGSDGTDSTGTTETGSTGTGSTGTGTTGTGSSGSSGNSGSSGTGSTVTSPQTSDSTAITALWMIVAFFGVAGCVALAVYKVRGANEQG